MAAEIPQEKSIELLRTYGDMLKLGMSINDMDYMRSSKELSSGDQHSANTISAQGLLYALHGNIKKSNEYFDSHMNAADNPHSVAVNYCFMLQETKQFELFLKKTYEFADRFESKRFSHMAYSLAYRYGDLDYLEKYMDMHIKSLSDEEGRCMAEKHKDELISELKSAYETTGCTNEQFALLSSIVFKVSQDFSADLGRFEASRNDNMAYVMEVKNKDPKSIAEMNFSLAEAICMEERLDNCKLTARFSPVRILHTGVSYDYKGC